MIKVTVRAATLAVEV